MGIKTVAESVEDEAILAALMLVGVDFAQGFHLGRPKPMLEAMTRLPAPVLSLPAPTEASPKVVGLEE
jgi:EAL domain-containing protein (putative c-di-GMP-specific phosphodiesterase class I)